MTRDPFVKIDMRNIPPNSKRGEVIIGEDFNSDGIIDITHKNAIRSTKIQSKECKIEDRLYKRPKGKRKHFEIE